MYLKQMGQVPLLTREQEVEISKRIEDAENGDHAGSFTASVLPARNTSRWRKNCCPSRPRERFDRVILDKKVDSRDAHLRTLRRLVSTRPETGPGGGRQIYRLARGPRQNRSHGGR